MKKVILTFMLITVLLLITGCSGLDMNLDYLNNNDAVHNTSMNTELSSEENNEDDIYSNLNEFISTYNKIADTPITNTIEIDIQSDEYYRTEFRLGAYQDAPALKGNVGNNTIEIINSNYDSVFGSDLRIYAVVETVDEATDIFESFCKACDPKITKDDFDDFYEFNSLDDGDCRILIGGVSGYVIIKDIGYDILLDATPEYFAD